MVEISGLEAVAGRRESQYNGRVCVLRRELGTAERSNDETAPVSEMAETTCSQGSEAAVHCQSKSHQAD